VSDPVGESRLPQDPIDLAPLLARVERIVARHEAGAPGVYARWLWPDADGRRELGPNPYGSADAANLLYTLGRLPGEPGTRAAWVAALQALQDPESGLYRESTHHPIHTTAHCLAALELFDARPLHPLAGIGGERAPEAVEPFLEGLAWRESPWLASHQGAGLHAALLLADALEPAWSARYFDWLWRESDPATGLWRRGAVTPLPAGAPTLFPHLAGTFHYLFNLEHARLPLRHPAALVDTCLAVLDQALFPLAHFVGFAEVDWAYCLNRARRQTPHRHAEATDALERLARRYVAFLDALDAETDEGLNDLHALFGALCALAELQAAVPGLLRSPRPLRLVLDRRPFI